MNEQSKAMLRRIADPAFATRYFVGEALDVGCGDDPLADRTAWWPGLTSVRSWDRPDGDGQTLAGVPDASFDVVHASHCLEHMADPVQALCNWLRVLRCGGHLVVTVPEWNLYERRQWPSRFNGDHKWAFVMDSTDHPAFVIGVIQLAMRFADRIDVRRMMVVDGFATEDAPTERDQTLGPAECAIEMVWRRRA